LGFFGTSVLAKTAFVNGPSAFMYVDGRITEPTHLKVSLPEGWKIATAADADPAGVYRAGGYDEMVDHPIQMGSFESRKFEVAGIPFEVVFVSKDQRYLCDLDAEAAQLKTIAAPAIKMFGGAPFKHYTFFLHLSVGDFNGGLEHRACNVIATYNSKRLDLDDLAAHEYFHAWNVKQIRPKILGPFDYTAPQRTGNLWFSEGVTDYYAQMTTYRSGLKDKDWLYRQLGNNVSELQRSRNRHKYSVSETSRITWENGGFGVGDLSYYTKGLLCGWLLDSAIRDATDGSKSLDDVMRLMFQRYRLPKPGFEENGILSTINEVAGKDLTALYNRIVNTTEELPYGELVKIGISVDPSSGRVTEDANASERAARLRKSWLDRPGSVG
jgi:predicted metalloprotease with PDZ domain